VLPVMRCWTNTRIAFHEKNKRCASSRERSMNAGLTPVLCWPARALTGRTKPIPNPNLYGGQLFQNYGARAGSAPTLCYRRPIFTHRMPR
jgi:hypothetical protein